MNRRCAGREAQDGTTKMSLSIQANSSPLMTVRPSPRTTCRVGRGGVSACGAAEAGDQPLHAARNRREDRPSGPRVGVLQRDAVHLAAGGMAGNGSEVALGLRPGVLADRRGQRRRRRPVGLQRNRVPRGGPHRTGPPFRGRSNCNDTLWRCGCRVVDGCVGDVQPPRTPRPAPQRKRKPHAPAPAIPRPPQSSDE